jgi:VWFA-related protein
LRHRSLRAAIDDVANASSLAGTLCLQPSKGAMTRAASVSILAMVSIALDLHAQAPVPQATFRAGTDLVQVDVSVLDGKRHPVRGLTAADFTISEDDQPREIQAFTEVSLPDRVQGRDASWTREVPSDVATNQAGQDEGRLVIIVLDRTIPVGEPTITARRIAAAAINQLGPADLAAVVSTSNGAVQNLTSDRSRLLRAISGSDLSTDISDEAKEIEASVFGLTGRTWSTLNDGRCLCGLCVLETITRVADAVQGTSRRRKVLFFIGSDLLVQVADPPGGASNDVGCGNRLKRARDAMFTAVDRANLTIHSLDPSGLMNVSPATRASSTLRVGSGPIGAAAMTSATADNLKRQGNLEVLPDRTGGRAVMNTNGPDLAVPEIFHESDSYYLVGFRPLDRSANGKFHRITVKTNRRGLDVRARSGYTAAAAVDPAGSPATSSTISEPVRDALTGLLPAGATTVDMTTAMFAVPGAQKAAIALTVGVGAFALPASDGAETPRGGPLEIVATAFDQGGRPKGLSRQTLDLSWPASATTGEHRFDALSRIDLAPGEYEVRVAVSGAARTASVFSYVTVPAFATAPLSLSSIVVGASAWTLTAPKNFLSALLPIVPTARREFARADRFVAFFRIYQGTARQDALAPVQLQSTIVDARGAVVATETTTLGVGRFEAGRTADYYVTIPLATLAPGDYLLKIEATMGTRLAGRAMRFGIKP